LEGRKEKQKKQKVQKYSKTSRNKKFSSGGIDDVRLKDEYTIQIEKYP